MLLKMVHKLCSVKGRKKNPKDPIIFIRVFP